MGKRKKNEHHSIWCDGGTFGNGKTWAMCYGSYKLGDDEPVHLDFPQAHTNNEAEYEALIAALEALIEQGASGIIDCYCDSQLICNQVSGWWGFHTANLYPLAQHVWKLVRASHFSLNMIWVPREKIVPVLGH